MKITNEDMAQMLKTLMISANTSGAMHRFNTKRHLQFAPGEVEITNNLAALPVGIDGNHFLIMIVNKSDWRDDK